jgi:site-specific DNA recombinase
LNDRGYRTRDGSSFSDTTVGRLIQDPTAKGVHRANYTRRVGDKKPWALKPEHEWVLTEVEPIIPVDLWEQCNKMLEARKTKLRRPARRTVHLFAGLTFCECGNKMYVPTHSPKYVCTRCRNKIPVVDLEAFFLDELKNYFFTASQVSKYLQKAGELTSEKNELLETLQKELQKTKVESEKIYRLYMDDGISAKQFKEMNNPLDERKQQLEQEIPRVEAEINLLKIDSLSGEYILEEAQALHADWPSMNTDERRRTIELLVKKVVIGKDEISISLCDLPSFKNMTTGQRLA